MAIVAQEANAVRESVEVHWVELGGEMVRMTLAGPEDCWDEEDEQTFLEWKERHKNDNERATK